MIPKKLLFEFKHCKSCHMVHGFDVEHPRFCVYAVIAAAGLGAPISVDSARIDKNIDVLSYNKKVDSVIETHAHAKYNGK